jgi:2,5-diketo-D-gluconate reductase A
MTTSNIPVTTLNNGTLMPRLGLGTWQMSEGKHAETMIVEALKTDYRLIDTAAVYGNEASVGRSIKDSGLKREEVFVTTKLWNSDQGKTATQAFEQSLARLGLDYVDLYLIHWPAPARDKYIDTWKVFEKMYQGKRVKAIGVSNFKTHHLKRLLSETQIVPAVNQIENHPYFQDLETISFCQQHDIQVESYSPLGGQGSNLLQEDIIQKIATVHNRSPAQIVIRWHIQNGYVVIPKASTHAHLQANKAVFDFELTQKDMVSIARLATNNKRGPDADRFNSNLKTGIVQLAHKFGLVHWNKEKR